MSKKDYNKGWDEAMLEAARTVEHHDCHESECDKQDDDYCWLSVELLHLQKEAGWCGFAAGMALEELPYNMRKEEEEG